MGLHVLQTAADHLKGCCCLINMDDFLCQHTPTHDPSGAGKEAGQGHWLWGWKNLRTRSQGAESKDRYSLAASKLPAFLRAILPHFIMAPGTAGLFLKRHIGPTFCHGTKAFLDREAVVACQRAGDPFKVITCLVLPTAGRNPKLGFEGGQTPLKKRAPRRGFHNP